MLTIDPTGLTEALADSSAIREAATTLEKLLLEAVADAEGRDPVGGTLFAVWAPGPLNGAYIGISCGYRAARIDSSIVVADSWFTRADLRMLESFGFRINDVDAECWVAIDPDQPSNGLALAARVIAAAYVKVFKPYLVSEGFWDDVDDWSIEAQ